MLFLESENTIKERVTSQLMNKGGMSTEQFLEELACLFACK